MEMEVAMSPLACHQSGIAHPHIRMMSPFQDNCMDVEW